MTMAILLCVLLMAWIAAPILYVVWCEVFRPQRHSGDDEMQRQGAERESLFWQGATVGIGYVIVLFMLGRALLDAV